MFPYEDAIGPNLEAVIKRNQRFYYQSDATIDPLKIWSLIWEIYLIAVLVIAKWKSTKIVVKWNLMEKKQPLFILLWNALVHIEPLLYFYLFNGYFMKSNIIKEGYKFWIPVYGFGFNHFCFSQIKFFNKFLLGYTHYKKSVKQI